MMCRIRIRNHMYRDIIVIVGKTNAPTNLTSDLHVLGQVISGHIRQWHRETAAGSLVM